MVAVVVLMSQQRPGVSAFTYSSVEGCCHSTLLCQHQHSAAVEIIFTGSRGKTDTLRAAKSCRCHDNSGRGRDRSNRTTLHASSSKVDDGANDKEDERVGSSSEGDADDSSDAILNGSEQQLIPNPTDKDSTAKRGSKVPSQIELQLMQRVMQLEQLVASQQVQIRHLLAQVKDLSATATAFGEVVALLREAGLNMQQQKAAQDASRMSSKSADPRPDTGKIPLKTTTKVTESLDDADSIFGTAPATVMDAADAAGASILAGLLGGKQRMLVDVRDAELSFSPEHSETLVQFIELAILPVAAGLEGLRSQRNRLKVVFPTVSHLLSYRKTMALAAPEVVALSTLGFDPVEKKDNLVVILVPSPDDAEGLIAMNELLESKSLTQPVVVVNHHMVPVSGPAADFEVAYHLRLLSVQYMSGDSLEQYYQDRDIGDGTIVSIHSSNNRDDDDIIEQLDERTVINVTATTATYSDKNSSDTFVDNNSFVDDDVDAKSPLDDAAETKEKDEALESAMKRALQVGQHQGVTRAMVIRAYPRPWHVFVDTSPDTDADFEVAGTFADEPGPEQVNNAIVECLEGGELEDELVAQQMQQALELGQLDRISEMLSSMGLEDFDEEDEDDDDDDDIYRNMFGEDSV